MSSPPWSRNWRLLVSQPRPRADPARCAPRCPAATARKAIVPPARPSTHTHTHKPPPPPPRRLQQAAPSMALTARRWNCARAQPRRPAGKQDVRFYVRKCGEAARDVQRDQRTAAVSAAVLGSHMRHRDAPLLCGATPRSHAPGTLRGAMLDGRRTSGGDCAALA